MNFKVVAIFYFPHKLPHANPECSHPRCCALTQVWVARYRQGTRLPGDADPLQECADHISNSAQCQSELGCRLSVPALLALCRAGTPRNTVRARIDSTPFIVYLLISALIGCSVVEAFIIPTKKLLSPKVDHVTRPFLPVFLGLPSDSRPGGLETLLSARMYAVWVVGSW